MDGEDQETKGEQPDKEVTDTEKADEAKKKGDQSHSNLFVSGLPEGTDEQGLRELFGEHGVIMSTRLYTRDGYGFVKFAEAAEAEEAIEAKNGYEHNGNKLTVRFANKDMQDKESGEGRSWREKGADDQPRREKAIEHSNLYVGSLPLDMEEQGLKEIFEKSGTVVSVRILKQAEAKEGYGFVKMDTVEEAAKAIQTLQGHQIGDKTMVVRFANSDSKDKEGKGKGKGKGKYDGGSGYSGASKGWGSKGGKGFEGGKGSWGGGFSGGKGYQEGKGASGGKGFDSWGKGGGGGFDSWGKGKSGDKGFSGGKQGGKSYPAKGGGKDSSSEDPRPRATSKQIIEAFQSLEGNWEGHDPRGNEQWHELTFEPDMDYPENSQIVVRTWTRGKVHEQRKIIYYKDGDILYGNGQIFLDMVSTRMALWKDWYRPEMQWKWMRR